MSIDYSATAGTATPEASTRSSRTAVAMFVVLLASYVVNAMDRQIFPLVTADVAHEYGFPLSAAGLLSTIFTLGMGVAGIPTAMLMARMKRRNVVIIGIVLFSVTTAVTAVATNYGALLAARAVSGLGEAMQLSALFAIAAGYFTRHRALAFGAVNACFAVGSALAPAIGGMLIAGHGWRAPLVVYGLSGFVFIVLIAVFVRPWFTERQPVEEAAAARTLPESLPGASTMWNRNTVLLVIASICGGVMIYAFLGMYPTYLQSALGFSVADKSLVMTVFGLGALCSLIGGWLGDRLGARTLLPSAFGIGLVLAVLLFTGITALGAHLALAFLWGAVVSGIVYVNLGAAHAKAVQAGLGERASGLFVTALYVPAAFSGYLVGAVTEVSGWSWGALSVIGTAAVVGAVSCLLLRPEQMSR